MAHADDPILRVEALAKHFGGVAAVDEVSAELWPGETVALIGPNGAGKTTFYNMVSGRMTPSAGRILFKGRDIAGMPPHRIARLGISRSFQITNVFGEMSVRENVQVALVSHRRKSLHLFRVLGWDRMLREEADTILGRLGLAEMAEARAETLSYGDKRLLELAIVLAIEPELVLLDEPTAGMTPEETRKVVALLNELRRDRPYTFFITEHDMSVVFGLADRVLVMHRGRLLSQGTPDQVSADPNVRAAYLGDAETK
ncbi:amino acid/amide ABC transporter ATP-binding protein 1, HAAT family [Limimonas halophila]|uniref:Amino acid/amide ABC transporter ATP-binding protein 1, HAAT family n=1 Tax=Limimonas halophila TaxID=1082479 RepID=A0A1G7Q227_9PROT|nr:ABC transporter ATP-binding protein [Limimonas halophila]SDF92535.1 amino acid/amide ABC transporter ATP-binding protein 1, HAAT family [Limimonas halophila]